MELLYLFLFTLAMYGSPGPATISIAASGLSIGFRNSLPYLSGILLGLLINISLSVIGMVSLMKAYPGIYEILKYVSVVYILYLSWKIFKVKIALNATNNLKFHDGVILNSINPKAYLGAAVVIEQSMALFSNGFNPGWTIVLVMLTGIMVDIIWCYAGHWIRSAGSNRTLSMVNKVFALVLGIIGLYGLLLK